MKTRLLAFLPFLLFLLFPMLVDAQTTPTVKSVMLKITNPMTGDELQVAYQDFPVTITWQEAKRSCSELGSGWRLPTKQELEIMYEQLHKKGQGNFKKEFYWTSSEDGNNHAWYFYFGNGNANYGCHKNTPNYVRAVRDL